MYVPLFPLAMCALIVGAALYVRPVMAEEHFWERRRRLTVALRVGGVALLAVAAADVARGEVLHSTRDLVFAVGYLVLGRALAVTQPQGRSTEL